MRRNGVEAAIARYREAGKKNMRTIGIAHKWGAHTWGFYCMLIFLSFFLTSVVLIKWLALDKIRNRRK